MQDRSDSRGTSGKAQLRAVARNARLMSLSRMEGAVTFFALQRLSRYAGRVGFTQRLGQGAASRAASASSSRGQREARCRRSRMEDAATFFALQRLSRYAGQVGVARSVGQGAASRAASASRSRRQREARCRRSRMEGAVTFFALQRLSRYAGQVGFARTPWQGAVSRATSASSSSA
jgi:hypothetical protein